MRNLKLKIILFVSCMFMLSACGPGAAPAARQLLSILGQFAVASLPLVKVGRNTASLSVGSAGLALKFEREMIKNGIKIGGSFPLGDFSSLAAIVYQAQNKEPLPDNAKFKEEGIFVILNFNGERTVFVSENESICVANVAEAVLMRVSINGRYVEVPVHSAQGDLMFGSSVEECDNIEKEIAARIVPPQKTLTEVLELIGIADEFVKSDSEPGYVTVKLYRNGSELEIRFNPFEFVEKNGLKTIDEVNEYVRIGRQEYDYCSEKAAELGFNNVVDMDRARGGLLRDKGYDENDQAVLEIKRVDGEYYSGVRM